MSMQMGGSNSQQHIHCTISNCHYWQQQNKCVANEIIVVSDTLGATKPDSYDHQMAMQAPQTPVDSCMATCCKTFVEKNSDKIKEDGTKRMK